MDGLFYCHNVCFPLVQPLLIHYYINKVKGSIITYIIRNFPHGLLHQKGTNSNYTTRNPFTLQILHVQHKSPVSVSYIYVISWSPFVRCNYYLHPIASHTTNTIFSFRITFSQTRNDVCCSPQAFSNRVVEFPSLIYKIICSKLIMILL